MNLKEMYELCLEVYKSNEDNYSVFGVRFENKERQIGEVCENSKDNPNREDERSFPEYGTDEYNELPSLNGTSAWSYHDTSFNAFNLKRANLAQDAQKYFCGTTHAYIVAGKYENEHPCPDDGEVLIEDAIVIAKIF